MKNKDQEYPKYRWVILFLVFLATMINYADRIVLGVTSTELKEALSLNDIQYGYVLTAFSTLYAVGFLIAGKVIDRLGTKLGYLLSMVLWSLSGAFTGLSRGLGSLLFWRGALGITESGNFPAAIKAVAEWFPPKQRALATSLFNSGPHISLVLGPPLIAVLTLSVGWRWAFIIIGLAGLPLAIAWHFLYRHPEHLDLKAAGAAAAGGESYGWVSLLRKKSTWGIMIGKFCTDPVWWFYIFWLPPFLNQKYGFDIKQIGWSMPAIYAIAILLANLAGWYTGHLMERKGWADYKARKWVMMLCAACLPVTVLSAFTPHPVVVILLVALAAGAHSGWSANIFTLVSDSVPAQSVGSVTGMAGFAGGLGGIVIASLLPGFIVQNFGYTPILLLMGVLHPIAFLAIHLTIKPEKTA
jgi:ACS family hexuronate transporter-like MFS transporter